MIEQKKINGWECKEKTKRINKIWEGINKQYKNRAQNKGNICNSPNNHNNNSCKDKYKNKEDSTK